MNILAIDTGGEHCSLALRINGQHVDQTTIPTQRDQAKILAPLTLELLSAYGLKVMDIDRFGIAIGPGSFTGLRVGLAFVRGLALASGKPVIGFDHFTIAAQALEIQCIQGHLSINYPLLMILESKRADLYCAWLNSDKHFLPYFLSSPTDLRKSLTSHQSYSLYGSGAAHLIQMDGALKNAVVELSETSFIEQLAVMTEAANTNNHTLPQPLYLRNADVTAPKQISHLA